jgi:hypothetical protein
MTQSKGLPQTPPVTRRQLSMRESLHHGGVNLAMAKLQRERENDFYRISFVANAELDGQVARMDTTLREVLGECRKCRGRELVIKTCKTDVDSSAVIEE